MKRFVRYWKEFKGRQGKVKRLVLCGYKDGISGVFSEHLVRVLGEGLITEYHLEKRLRQIGLCISEVHIYFVGGLTEYEYIVKNDDVVEIIF